MKRVLNAYTLGFIVLAAPSLASAECQFEGLIIGENVAVSFGGGTQQCRKGGEKDKNKETLMFRDPSGTPNSIITVCIYSNQVHTAGVRLNMAGATMECGTDGKWTAI